MTTLITGANRGIGRALLEASAARGETVIGTARHPMDADRATPHVTWQPLDLEDSDAPARMADRLAGQKLDLLVCNAGIYTDKGQSLATGFPAALWAQTFAVNVTGVFLTIQALLPNLRAARGKIAIISSQMASSTRATGGSYIYRASKAAALNFGRNLATDLAPEGIAVGIYHPGWVKTDMGGTGADISVEDAADGLLARFDALGPTTTGCFETWDGRAHPY